MAACLVEAGSRGRASRRPVLPRAVVGFVAATLVAAALPGCGALPFVRTNLEGTALRAEFVDSPHDDAIAAFYRSRGYRPLWTQGRILRPEAHDLLDMLDRADEDAIDPTRYDISRLAEALDRARSDEPATLAEAEVLLSRALADHVSRLRTPPAAAATIFTDPELAPPAATPAAVLDSAARATSLRDYLLAVRRMNPIYEGLRQGLAAYRARWDSLPSVRVIERRLAPGMTGAHVRALRLRLGLPASPAVFDESLAAAVRRFQADHALRRSGVADVTTIRALNSGHDHYEHLIRLNMDRARALPESLGHRYILVNAASASLRLYEAGRPAGEMRVIVGREDQQTPMMASLMRFAVLKPYWNVPPDIARNRFAAHFAREGSAYLSRERLELLSDWSDAARPLDPAEVDWSAVAAGRLMVRVRQLPGPGNVMGAVKFMMPNRLGIYLHDTPDKSAFSGDDRRLSSGCVRLEDAPMLLRWLFHGKAPKASGEHDQRVDLPGPVPVYVTYLTAVPEPEGIRFYPDGYGRDAAQI